MRLDAFDLPAGIRSSALAIFLFPNFFFWSPGQRSTNSKSLRDERNPGQYRRFMV